MNEVGGIEVLADLRGHWTGVRDQGARPTCLACATSDAHAHAHQLDHPLSAEYVFYMAAQQMPGKTAPAGLSFQAAELALRHNGQPREVTCPYQPKPVDAWAPPSCDELWYGDLSTWFGAGQDVVDTIISGIPVVLAVSLVPGFMRVQAAPHIIEATGSPAGGHAVLAVGCGRSSKAGPIDLILVRNSWGFRWGFGGHAWLPLQYLKDKLIGARKVDALP